MKNKVNYSLLNALIIMGIVYLVTTTSKYWLGLIGGIVNIILPFFLAFVFAYILHPFVERLENRGVRRKLALGAVIFIFFAILVGLLWFTVPAIYDQLVSFSKNISKALNDISGRFDLNLGEYQVAITDALNQLIKNVGSYISTGTIDIIGKSVNIVTNTMIILIVGIYMLIDMDKIRGFIKKSLKKHPKGYEYVKALDHQMGNYLHGLAIFMLVQLVEYALLFRIVGHPSWLLLGILACITTVIPYFGGLFTNIIAVITASVISTKLFISTLVITLIFPNIDGYIISPHIYGKTNNINPILVIFIGGAFSSIFGIFGFMLGLPVYLVLRTTWEFFDDDIKEYLEDRKEAKKN